MRSILAAVTGKRPSRKENGGDPGNAQAVLHRTRTRDGYEIGVWNYPNRGANARETPVLLVHGLGSNRNDLDGPVKRYSLARHVHAAGFDTWVVELRGAGASNDRLRKHLRGFTIDDYVVHDIPAAFRLIEDVTRKDAVHWIGHSLGGMLAYPILATGHARRIRSAVTLGAPAMQKTHHRPLEFAIPFAKAVMKRVPCLWGYKRGGQLASFVMPLAAKISSRYLFTAGNCDLKVLARLTRCALDDVPSGVHLQLLGWYAEKRMTTLYGTVDPIAALSTSTVPLLVVAGSRDNLTPLADVRIPYDLSASPRKALLVCGKEQGFSADYGHIDLVFGLRAPDEIFPRIRDFLIDNDRKETVQASQNGTQHNVPAGKQTGR